VPDAASPSAPTLALLGPQAKQPNVRETAQQLGMLHGDRPVAVITSGWEEREREEDELFDHLGVPALNLGLWSRTERVFLEDPELFAALRQRHDSARRLRRLYRRRLDHADAAVRDLLQPRRPGSEDEFRVLEILERGDDDLLAEVVSEALDDIRRIDAAHLSRVDDLRAAFEDEWRPGERPAMAREREAVAERVEQCSGVLIAGGHVAVLLNRLRLFAMSKLLPGRPVVAWSAGAMVLTERIVLFHDSPPHGFGLPEVFETGLALAKDVVALPGAATRLLLDDQARVTRLARRMEPAHCLPLDAGEAALFHDGVELTAPRSLCVDGTVSAA